MKKILPIGNDSFRMIRERNFYYVDKTLMIKDFIEFQDTVALITRPRRFGKTLNMTMLREFFDITVDSRELFSGLAIMDTEYAGQINSRPVIYLTFKDCKAVTVESLLFTISTVVFKQYDKYYPLFKENVDESKSCYFTFFMVYEKLLHRNIDINFLQISVECLEQAVTEYYQTKPIVLMDEYDQPIISSYEQGYHDKLKTFFSGFYGSVLKGQEYLYQALLTGIQRIAKESIFSQLNNVKVYTVVNERYANYFGLNGTETKELLACYGLALNEPVKQKYNGYLFGKTEIYNPWSILYYAETGQLENYWINTSTNFLVRETISKANEYFQRNFDKLISDEIVKVSADLECSFIELKHNDTIWGLLINSGYVTVLEQVNEFFVKIRIPNGEVRGEFLKIIADRARVESRDLQIMFQCLLERDMEGFMETYSQLVMDCTSYFDAKENAYHMLFLGMCISLNNLYKITSNIESGYGRSDIRMESLSKERPHIVIEFKQGEAVGELKEKALRQIVDNRYYEGLTGEVLCIGIAHDKKKCALAHKTIRC